VHEIERGQLRAPARVLDIDVANAFGDDVIDVEGYATAFCLARENGVVVDGRWLNVESESSIRLDSLREFLVGLGLPRPAKIPEAIPIPLTVVIPTNRREALPTALASLAAQTDMDFEVLIVDNSPDGEVARTLTQFDGLNVRCCHEPTPGVARARNRGLSEVSTEYTAWIDDDEVADPNWIAWLKRGFATPAKPDAVAGMMLPAELETNAQVNFERYGGFNKGRPFQPLELRAGAPSVADPLYPLPNFGSSGNMAFRTETLRAIGGFNNRLGTPRIHGGEDTWVLSFALESGATVMHWPPAVTWHYHRRTDEELERQFFCYTAALTAYYTGVLIKSPKYIWRVSGFVLPGLRRTIANRRSGRDDGVPEDFPESLLRQVRKGLFSGPWLYLREIWRQRNLPQIPIRELPRTIGYVSGGKSRRSSMTD
jgi:glycosyltransferase involved in cell wall biosynthesis